ncbi:MAG: glucosidase, partial [Myxococcota bacterium]
VEYPTRSGEYHTLKHIAHELGRRLTRIFLNNERGLRPALANHPKMSHDPHFKDHVLFYEYFHGDTGRGVGASHQTGWTGLVAALIGELGGSE